jgi:hypothetical protein
VRADTELRPARDCWLCAIPEREELDKYISEYDPTAAKMIAWLAEHGHPAAPGRRRPPGRNTVNQHKAHHVKATVLARNARVRKDVKDLALRAHAPSDVDLATLIVEETTKGVLARTLRPSINEGLRAQELIDKRRSGAANRDLMVALAAISSGVLPPAAIEGEFCEVDAEREEDEAWARRLASGQ